MDRRKLVAQVVEKSGYAKWEVNKITEALLGSITETLEQGEDIHINNFGKFTIKYHKPKETLHPKTRQRIKIPEKASIVFTQARMFKPTDEAIEALRKQSEK